jgi:hypothetical protein
MILAAMQPYFFPYLGYFDLINRCDRWVVFDLVSYAPRSWMNRNRILHPISGWQYVTVPVHHHAASRAIKDILIVDKTAARQRILGQLEHYRHGGAPFFESVSDLVRQGFAASGSSDRLRDLNVETLSAVCRYLDLKFDFVVLSQAGLTLPPIQRAGQWALEIATAFAATDYINAPGGRGLFDEQEFREHGIRLHFTQPIEFSYTCRRYRFAPDLSIIDVLMWNAPEIVRALLHRLKHQGPQTAPPELTRAMADSSRRDRERILS